MVVVKLVLKVHIFKELENELRLFEKKLKKYYCLNQVQHLELIELKTDKKVSKRLRFYDDYHTDIFEKVLRQARDEKITKQDIINHILRIKLD